MSTGEATRVATVEPATGGGDIEERRSCGSAASSNLSAPLAGASSRFQPGCDEAAFPALVALRQRFGWTRRQLADRMQPFLGFDPLGLLRRIEQHGQVPDGAFVTAVASAFAISRAEADRLFTEHLPK